VKHVLWTAALASCLGSTPVLAQSNRPFVGGLGMVMIGPSADAVVGGRAGLDLNRHVAVFGEFGHMTDLMPRELDGRIDGAAHALVPDRTVVSRSQLSATYAFGGAIARCCPLRAPSHLSSKAGSAWPTSIRRCA